MSLFSYIGAYRSHDSQQHLNRAIRHTITHIHAESNHIMLHFKGGYRLRIEQTQMCCESRYFHTDDPLDDFTGATLQGVDISEVTEQASKYGIEEMAFLNIRTSLGVIVFSAHNEHDGYYSGIYPHYTFLEPAQE